MKLAIHSENGRIKHDLRKFTELYLQYILLIYYYPKWLTIALARCMLMGLLKEKVDIFLLTRNIRLFLIDGI